eukprot:TRINITY_DN13447_c0_g1_i1.p1 TRINITY_DN13447_c0_g1~~TRINITY_DN13447_c0_g1_i1.p1  ORF type:complete len:630 (+),score=120.28 TRINITY_DN13447_c0_g1_i1:217-2106(+)
MAKTRDLKFRVPDVLNTISGRSFNDLTQYPVFPWVISDWTSTSINLEDDSIYRDLSKPIGALNMDRLALLRRRMDDFFDPIIPPFLYGTHYSNSGFVLFYLLRLEPYTTQALILQGNKFDFADRLFDSLPLTWYGCLTNPADVKELIPEFFYFPEFLKNVNEYDLGVKQTGVKLWDVVLPPWAKTPEEFIRIHRKALESRYVSEHLHEWIDLIWGYKQRGEEAVKADNVFFHLTYEGEVDIDSIEDPGAQKATIDQINNFGQTPSQLLSTPHPKRLKLHEADASFFKKLDSVKCYVWTMVFEKQAMIFIGQLQNAIVTVASDRSVAVHKWKPYVPEIDPPFSFDVEKRHDVARRKVGILFAARSRPSESCFAVSNDGKYLFTCCHWDNSVRCSFLESCRTVQSLYKHRDVVTCLALDETCCLLVTGSKDTTVLLWDVSTTRNPVVVDKPRQVLFGHDDEVTCVAISSDLDVVISGSKDGTCIVHSVHTGQYIRTIRPDHGKHITSVTISSRGDFAIYCSENNLLQIFTINGTFIKEVDTMEALHAIRYSKDGDYLITGGEKREIRIRDAFSLQIDHRLEEPDASIRTLAITENEQHLLVGLSNGKILIYALDSSLLRQRMLVKLNVLGF